VADHRVRARAAAAVATSAVTAAAAREAAQGARDGLAGASADLVLVFLSPEHVEEAAVALAAVQDVLAPAALAGTTGEAVIGAGRELEGEPGVSVLAAHLPATRVAVHHVTVQVHGDRGILTGLPEGFSPSPLGPPMVMLADPYTFPASEFLALLNDELGGVLVVGGMASGSGPGRHVLLRDGEVLHGGALVLELDGAVELHALVSQGCAPIGPDLVITAAERNLVLELAGRPAYERLVEVVDGLAPEERALVRGGVMVGLVIDENRAEYGRGDYLVRGVLAADEATGALAIGDIPRVGQTVRFHARDEASADRDLAEALAVQAALPGHVVGGLLFACNGRGTRMFSRPHHDAASVDRALGAVPVAGMFCAGEIGPVGGVNFLHGFTATLALLVQPDPAALAGGRELDLE
jgi:small ligand-binding sensory domain FIST